MVIYGTQNLTCRGQARELLALAAAEHWGLSPLPELARSGEGKPFFPGRADLHFNLSHSGNLALCALDGSPVGADIQAVRRWRPSLPRRVCTGEELAWLEAQPDFWPAFTRLWALKESRIKQRGQGWPRFWNGSPSPCRRRNLSGRRNSGSGPTPVPAGRRGPAASALRPRRYSGAPWHRQIPGRPAAEPGIAAICLSPAPGVFSPVNRR